MRAPLPSLALFMLLALAASPLHAAPIWQLTTADASYRAGMYGSMRLDAAGEPHMSSWAYTGLRHTWHDAGGWHGESVSTAALASTAPPARNADRGHGTDPAHTELLVWLLSSIAIDPAGEPHIAWTNTNDVSVTGPTYTAINYCSRTNGGWTSEAAGPEHGEAPSLDIDASGRPFIAYATATLNYTYAVGIHCVSRDAGPWTVTVVDSPAYRPSLRIDPAGVPHVAYDGPNGIRYATLGPSGWTYEPVAPLGSSPSLAFTSAGEPRIAYSDGSNHMAYAERIQGAWITSVADSTSGMDVEPSLALSPTGEPRIAYESQGAFRPWFAWRNGGTWTTGAIDPAHDGYYEQIGVDALGRVFVAYADYSLQQMRWAEGSQPTAVPAPRVPSGFALAATSPIHDATTLRLRLTLDRDEAVALEAFDVSGRHVAARASERFSAGVHDLTWPIAPGRGGFFVVRAHDGSGRVTSARVIAVH